MPVHSDIMDDNFQLRSFLLSLLDPFHEEHNFLWVVFPKSGFSWGFPSAECCRLYSGMRAAWCFTVAQLSWSLTIKKEGKVSVWEAQHKRLFSVWLCAVGCAGAVAIERCSSQARSCTALQNAVWPQVLFPVCSGVFFYLCHLGLNLYLGSPLNACFQSVLNLLVKFNCKLY